MILVVLECLGAEVPLAVEGLVGEFASMVNQPRLEGGFCFS